MPKKNKPQYILQEEHALTDEARPLFHRLLLGGVIRETYLKDLAMHLRHFPEEPISELDMIKGIITDHVLHSPNLDAVTLLDQVLFNYGYGLQSD